MIDKIKEIFLRKINDFLDIIDFCFWPAIIASLVGGPIVYFFVWINSLDNKPKKAYSEWVQKTSNPIQITEREWIALYKFDLLRLVDTNMVANPSK